MAVQGPCSIRSCPFIKPHPVSQGRAGSRESSNGLPTITARQPTLPTFFCRAIYWGEEKGPEALRKHARRPPEPPKYPGLNDIIPPVPGSVSGGGAEREGTGLVRAGGAFWFKSQRARPAGANDDSGQIDEEWCGPLDTSVCIWRLLRSFLRHKDR